MRSGKGLLQQYLPGATEVRCSKPNVIRHLIGENEHDGVPLRRVMISRRLIASVKALTTLNLVVSSDHQNSKWQPAIQGSEVKFGGLIPNRVWQSWIENYEITIYLDYRSILKGRQKASCTRHRYCSHSNL
jgi:LSD1 subclass zinc finger protein